MTVTSIDATRAPARYTFELATGRDDAEVRRLLRDVEMQGALRVALEREPHTTLGDAVEGPEHQRVVARHAESGALVAMGCRSVRERWIDGRPQRVGYYGELRIDPRHRARPSLARGGFRVLRRLHDEDGRTQHYFASVIADNHKALRLFEAELPGLPRCRSLGELVTFVLRVRERPHRGAREVDVRAASAADLDELVACLAHHGRRADLTPCWTRADLLSAERTPGLAPEDFLIASRAGHTVGCLALWDQRAFKQVAVRGYATWLGRLRRPVNVGLALSGRPALPAPGTRLEQAFLSHVAVEDEAALFALVAAAETAAAARGLRQLVLGLGRGGALCAAAERKLPAWRYVSRLLALPWDDACDGWQPHDVQPDVAVL